MKRFIVIDSTDEKFNGQLFFSETAIRTIVKLPFTNEEYRCTMFNGIDIKLVNNNNNNKFIKATLR